MKLAVVDPTNRDGELIADSASEGTRLHKRQVMRIRRRSAADKACLPGHELPVLLIAHANRFPQGADCALARGLTGYFRSFLAIVRIRPIGRHHVSGRQRIAWLGRAFAIADAQDSCLKFLFHNSGIPSCKRVLGGQIPTRPGGRLLG